MKIRNWGMKTLNSLFDQKKNYSPKTNRFKRFFIKPKPSLKENVATAIFILESTSNKLKFLSEGLKKRDKKIFMKCIDAQINNDKSRAIMYANECAEIRRFARLVISSELVLEQSVLRLHTLNKLGDALATLAPVVKIVEETKGRLVGVVPSVSNKLNQVNSMLRTSLSEMGSTEISLGPPNNSIEAIKILEEANISAEEKIREKFPKFPEELENSRELKFRIPIALTATGESSDVEVRGPFKQHVYEYIKECNGQISIKKCASSLNLSSKEVEEALLKLKTEGKIIDG